MDQIWRIRIRSIRIHIPALEIIVFLSLKFIFYYKNIQTVHNQVLQDSAPRGAPAAARNNAQTTNAVNIIQQEWFKLSSTKTSNPLDVEDYLDFIENMSKDLLEQVYFVFLSISV